MAATAFLWLPNEYSSCSCRVMPRFSAIASALMPMWWSSHGDQRPSWIIASCTVIGPMR
jgi:hypothetical protein